MLKRAYTNANEEELNKLILDGDYPYLSFSAYEDFQLVKIDLDTWSSYQYVSVDDLGNILGYFSFRTFRSNEKLNGGMFVKFRYKNYYNEEICNEDFLNFVDMCMKDPQFSRVEFMAIEDNHANITYEKWLKRYNGERFLLSNYIKLKDGKFYNVYWYWFDKIK